MVKGCGRREEREGKEKILKGGKKQESNGGVDR